MIETEHTKRSDDLPSPDRLQDLAPHCLAWWRSKPADRYDAASVRAMRITLSAIEMPDEDRWAAASMGDPAAAIGIAYRFKSHARWPFDAAMTALALAATTGNAAACLVLATVLRGIPGAGKAEARIAGSWLASAFAAHRTEHRQHLGENS